jgi:protein required for attachment to host cells
MRMPKVLYIVADGGRVRYVERLAAAHFKTLHKAISAQIHEKAAKITRDRPSRIRESATTARHAKEPRMNPRDKVEKNFIQDVARDLQEGPIVKDFDLLVLIAPGKLLNVFRAALSPDLLSKVIECIDKDLTKVPDADLARHLPFHVIPQTVS